MVLKLLKPLLYSQAFDQLHTKEQLGYNVQANISRINGGRSVLSFSIQRENNPLFTKLRIDHFVTSVRAQIAEMTVDDFQTRINSLSRLILEKPKSIASKANNVWGNVISGEYDFGKKQKQVDALNGLEISDLLDFWDKYVNPETTTASSYTRIDYLVWSQKAWIPTSKELVSYSENTIALQGCLLNARVVNVSLSKISNAVAAIASSSANAQDNTSNGIFSAVHLLYKDAESTSKSKVALEMMIAQQHRYYESATNYSGIDMQRTPEGKWIIRNISELKAALKLFELPVSVAKLEPKYAN
ncbi:metalloprotease [Coemansia spiralis]|uniref:Metalloprotease n=2 Tax=Coemansia TaxID=4863 RepID=A0A9W8KXH1_9FUNG|nr:metalloprotease [Coemansia umbellata]KAJ2621415.1 metalloprotease [Coemansia sp. RSA 1358]KAJ2674390.1 metalloprotease [Coemansia spiralis]